MFYSRREYFNLRTADVQNLILVPQDLSIERFHPPPSFDLKKRESSQLKKTVEEHAIFWTFRVPKFPHFLIF